MYTLVLGQRELVLFLFGLFLFGLFLFGRRFWTRVSVWAPGHPIGIGALSGPQKHKLRVVIGAPFQFLETVRRGKRGGFGFLDPPYAKGLADKALVSLRDGGWLTSGALLVVEEAKAAGFKGPDGFTELERRAYDDTEFVILRSA